ncbi:MATE family efflux transporter [Flavobacterium noncentrifugens]|uniref:Membrane protein involved in the export of O-antigen and teichoic acid n=1 Tax=Flavobacterium noncentrifugens TaxID=1128970 RepID=A0A1G8S1D6_9FLAO|nr:hypothetical protein [Flavobacterium noncentrifugens]SDJ23037.1 hypothetical protein SAMN04487935_0369 [Flavobacterium noncentrifugens]
MRQIQLKTKTINRIGFITGNAFRQVLIAVFGMTVPFVVIHNSSKIIWGSFVPLLLFSLLAAQIINWGNKEYLLRIFSKTPGKINVAYSQNLVARLPILIFFSILTCFYFPVSFGIWISLWLSGRYLQQSTEALIVYEKKFSASIVIELFAFAIFCIAFLLFNQHDLYFLLIFYSSYQILKGCSYFLLFYGFFNKANLKPDFSFFTVSFPFFVLSILGFLASKVDVYLLAHLGNKIATSDYQIINSLLVFVMSLSALIYAPFTKNIYRNKKSVIQKTRNLLAISGLVLVPISLCCITLIACFYLGLHLSFLFYTIAFFYIFPSFLYGIEVINLFRSHKEKTVVVILFFGATANTILSGLFLYFDFGMTGALLGSAIAQLMVLFLFKLNLYFEK